MRREKRGLSAKVLIEIGHVEAIYRYPVKSMGGERVEEAKRGGGVRGLGAGLSGAFISETYGGGSGSVQALWVADYTGEKGLYWSVNGGPATGQTGIGVLGGLDYLTSTTNASATIDDVVNSSFGVGFSAAAGLGAGVNFSPQTDVVTGTIGVGLGGWGGGAALNVKSGFIPVCGG